MSEINVIENGIDIGAAEFPLVASVSEPESPAAHPAVAYLSSLFEPGDHLNIKLIHATEQFAPGQAKTFDCWGPTDEAVLPEFLELMAQKQGEGWHIFVCMNPLQPEAGLRPPELGNRVEELITEIRTVYLEVDENGDHALEAIEAAVVNAEIPRPHFILQSSPGKYQIIWKVAGFTLPVQRAMNEALVARFGGDPASTDGVRVLRIPGFANLKPKYGVPPPMVTIVKHDDSGKDRYEPEDFTIAINVEPDYPERAAVAPEQLSRIIYYLADGLEAAGVASSQLMKHGTSFKYILNECPWGAEHTTGRDGAAAFVSAAGLLGFHCWHTHCKNRRWQEFRAELEARAGHPLVFGDSPRLLANINATDKAAPSETDAPGESEEDFHRTELGNAKRLVSKFGLDIRYNHEQRRWHGWDGKTWTRDRKAAMKNRMKDIAQDMLREAAKISNPYERGVLVKWALRSESEKIINGGLALAASEVPVLTEEFDRDEYLLNLNNGVLDLRTGEFFEHRRNDMLTKITSVDFDPAAECPRWRQFLEEVMDAETIPFLQRAIGYSLTGFTGEHCFFLLYGLGRNGKSVFLSVIQHLLGDYAMQTDWQSFAVAKNGGVQIRNDIARLHGSRFVAAVESEKNVRMAESLIKTLTGGDKITARFLYQEAFEFHPQFKLWLATNHKPKVIGTDEAIWSRIKLIPFEVTVPPEKRDRHLTEKLMREASGILNWALDGLKMYQRDGLKESKTVSAATALYRGNSDVLQHYLDDKCILAEGLEVRSSELYASYKNWVDASGEFKMKERDFVTAMDERGFKRLRTSARKNKPAGHYWLGVMLIHPETVEPVETSPPPKDEQIPF